MKLFQATYGNSGQQIWFGTRAEAQADLRTIAPEYRTSAYITEWEIPTDKAGVIALVNGGPYNWTELRTWSMTKRGGLSLDKEP
jgi:hypothetical protein